MYRKLEMLCACLGLLVLGLLWTGLQWSSGQAQPDIDWPAFRMIHKHEVDGNAVTLRLQWNSKRDWTQELIVFSGNAQFAGSAIPGTINSRVQFVNGEYTIYNRDGTINRVEQLANGTLMAPERWLAPGFGQALEERYGYRKLTPTIPNRATFVQESRPGRRSEISLRTDYQIPIEVSEWVDGRLQEHWTTLEITFQ